MSHKLDQSMEHLQEALAEILREVIEFPRDIFVTVLKARMTRNAKYASVLLSVMPNSEEQNVIKQLLRENHTIKDELAHRLRMRRIPSIHWTFDETESEAAKIEEIINQLKIKGEL
ncbi:ribosome-binding factor A [Candidatus Uhrbacteria bacterium]|nr:ribosome-binding factor A [Candidatus Uhrbacteria bacterium]